MPHNGHIGQINANFPDYWGNRFALINAIKQAGGFFSGTPSPDDLDENGYPLNNDATIGFRQLWIPSQDKRPGNWVWRWVRDGTVAFNSTSVSTVSGSLSGVNGRYVFTPTGTPEAEGYLVVNIGITDINEANRITDMAMMHEDDEALWEAGEIFTPQYLARMSNFGTIRFLNDMHTNLSMLARWQDRTPVGALSYAAPWYPSGMYKGVTTHIGDAYAIDVDGFVLENNATITIRFDATCDSPDWTLNVSETGDFPLLDATGGPLNSFIYPAQNGYAVARFDELLEGWILYGGGGIGATSLRGINGGWPPEICLALSLKVGAHPWFCLPHCTLDPVTDFVTGLATLCKDFRRDFAPWMFSNFELSNEVWNALLGFLQTFYAWNKAFARWGVTTATNNWMGMVGATAGEAISDVFEDDRTQYAVISGVQTVSLTSPSQNDPRMLSTLWVNDDPVNHSQAKEWVTHVALADYFGHNHTATAELQAATDWALLDGDEADAQIANFIETCPNRQGDQLNARYAGMRTWAASHGVKWKAYEGGFSMDRLAADMTTTATGMTNAANGVFTLQSGSALPPVGSGVSFSGFVGSTGANGQTATVLAVNPTTRQVTTDRDTTGDGTYVSDGTVTFIGSKTLRNAYRFALKFVPALEDMTIKVYSNHVRHGGESPSLFELAAGDSAWSALDPDIYGAETPYWEGARKFSTQQNRVRFRFNVNAAA